MTIVKIVKILTPIVAVVVVFESVMLLINLNKPKNVTTEPLSTELGLPKTTVAPANPKGEAALDLVFAVSDKAMKVGDRYQVGLTMMPKRTLAVDSFEVFVKYDPTFFEVSNVAYNPKIGKATSAKASKEKGLVVLTIYVTDPKGFSLLTDVSADLMNFSVKPLKAGIGAFEINAGNGQGYSATMIVENGKASAVPFVTNKLEITIRK